MTRLIPAIRGGWTSFSAEHVGKIPDGPLDNEVGAERWQLGARWFVTPTCS